jgi:hypothetical protein
MHYFILQFLQYELTSLIKAIFVMFTATAELVACSPAARVTRVQFPPLSFFFKHMALETIMFVFVSIVFELFFFFLHSFTFENDSSTAGISTWKTKYTPIFYNSEALHIVDLVWNTSD